MKTIMQPGAARFSLTDLIDKKNLLAWLNADGKPPTVLMRDFNVKQYGMGQKSKQEIKPVSDEATLDQWWGDYRAALTIDFSKSAANKHKPQTHTQFIQECLKACGIKSGGTVQERVQRAILMRPDRYTDAAQVKALEAARLEALKVEMNLTTNLEGRAA